MCLPDYRHVSVLPSVQRVLPIIFLPKSLGQSSSPFCAKSTWPQGLCTCYLFCLLQSFFPGETITCALTSFWLSVQMSHQQRALPWQSYIDRIPFSVTHISLGFSPEHLSPPDLFCVHVFKSEWSRSPYKIVSSLRTEIDRKSVV